MRQTAMQRPVVKAELISEHLDGYAPTDQYVRTFWISVVGPGAVADLLRLAAAAHSGRPLKRPNNLGALIREGLAHPTDDGTIKVHQRVPELNAKQVRRLPPALRRQHQEHRL
ncbi:MAG: hypothetical protein ACR2NG_05550, partial [Acidimicrobiia bacterium]